MLYCMGGGVLRAFLRAGDGLPSAYVRPQKGTTKARVFNILAAFVRIQFSRGRAAVAAYVTMIVVFRGSASAVRFFRGGHSASRPLFLFSPLFGVHQARCAFSGIDARFRSLYPYFRYFSECVKRRVLFSRWALCSVPLSIFSTFFGVRQWIFPNFVIL